MEKYGDAKLPELLYVLADCPKARSQSVYDQCKAMYGKTADGARRRAWSHLERNSLSKTTRMPNNLQEENNAATLRAV
jgi:hypothetical protein